LRIDEPKGLALRIPAPAGNKQAHLRASGGRPAAHRVCVNAASEVDMQFGIINRGLWCQRTPGPSHLGAAETHLEAAETHLGPAETHSMWVVVAGAHSEKYPALTSILMCATIPKGGYGMGRGAQT
jgi:hypothetical protein